MRAIRQSGSMSGMWKRSHGRTSEAPPDESGGYRYVRPTATALHLDTKPPRPSPRDQRRSAMHARSSHFTYAADFRSGSRTLASSMTARGRYSLNYRRKLIRSNRRGGDPAATVGCQRGGGADAFRPRKKATVL